MFDYFVGIDWSGAKGRSHKGISVFCAPRGMAVPEKVMPPSGDPYFSRQEVVSYLQYLSSNARVLAGIDFAFAYPFADEGCISHASPRLNCNLSMRHPFGRWWMIVIEMPLTSMAVSYGIIHIMAPIIMHQQVAKGHDSARVVD